MPRSLYLQVVLSLSASLVVTVLPFAWWIGRTQARLQVDAMREHALVVAHVEAENAAHHLVIEEYAGLEEQLLDAARIPGVRSVHVYEPDGTPLTDIHRDSELAEPYVSYALERGSVPTGPGPQVEERHDRLVVWAPIAAGTLLGWLKTTYGLDSVERMQASIWRQTFALGAIWIAAGILVVTIVLRRPMGAIHELSLFARDLARRKGERLHLAHGADEIGHLASALDHASVELADSERQLVAERERLAITLQSIGEGVLACDRDGRITLMNGVAEALTGWTAGDAVGRPLAEVFRVVDEVTGEPLPVTVEGAIDSGHAIGTSGHGLLLARNGERHPVSDSGAPLVDPRGQAIGAVVVFRDESARVEAERQRSALEAQLRQAQKMEAIGQLAGGIAHDFNNILTAIIGDGSLVVDMSEEGDPRREAGREVVAAAQRAATLTRGLLAFSRKQPMELRPVDLNEVVRGVERMLSRVIGEQVTLRTALSDRPLVVRADAAQLEQVLLNLATNARDAMPEGGLLAISTHEVTQDAEARGADDIPPEGRSALLTLSDTGAGMDEEVAQRIFEPFFTTKASGRGTGLGLSIVHGIVQQHGGTIHVYSRRGIGTTFRLYLPLDAGAPAAAGVKELQPPPRGTERILLVEDEANVRRAVRRMLEGAGYRVTEAAAGAEALELLAAGGEPIRLVVSDVIMPGMNGRELLRAVRARWAALPVLFVTGYAWDVIEHRGLVEPEVEVLMKPFPARALLSRVRELLDR